MIKEIEINNFDRKDLFEHYNAAENPYLFVSVNINVSNAVNFAKKNKTSFYATMGYLVTKSINEIENFKYRFDGEKFFLVMYAYEIIKEWSIGQDIEEEVET